MGKNSTVPGRGDTSLKDPQIGLETFRADDIFKWRMQCIVFALMTLEAGKTLAGLLGRQPTWVELYLSQMIGAKPAAAAIANPAAPVDWGFAGLKPQDFSLGGLTANQILDRYSAFFRGFGSQSQILNGSEAIDRIGTDLEENLDFIQKIFDVVGAELLDSKDLIALKSLAGPTTLTHQIAGGVYISYRREDSAGYARVIYNTLCDRLGPDEVYFDSVGLQPSGNWAEDLFKRVSNSRAVIAVIGKNWARSVGSEDPHGIDNPHDFVRTEIEAALQMDIRVIPVLVDAATMPRPDELPDSLKALTRRQAITISRNRFESDIETLTRALQK